MTRINAAANGDGALVFAYDFIDYPQTQPGSGGAFCSGESIKNAWQKCGGDSPARVSYNEPEPRCARSIPAMREANANPEPAALGHGIDGIVDEVRKHLSHVVYAAVELFTGPVIADKINGECLNPSKVKRHHRVHDVAEALGPGTLALLVKAQGVNCNLCHPHEFPVSNF